MDDVIAKIERGELALSVGNWVGSEMRISALESCEILRLAKLGLAAEQAFSTDEEYVNCIKGPDDMCEELCVWVDFCRLRTLGGADNV